MVVEAPNLKVRNRSFGGLTRRPVGHVIGESAQVARDIANQYKESNPEYAKRVYEYYAGQFYTRGLAGAVGDGVIATSAILANNAIHGINMLNIPESVGQLAQHPEMAGIAGAAMLGFAAYRLVTRPWRSFSYLYAGTIMDTIADRIPRRPAKIIF